MKRAPILDHSVLPRQTLPDWLPPSVVEEVTLLHEDILRKRARYQDIRGQVYFGEPWPDICPRYSTSSSQLEVLWRIASDPKMELVWEELYKKHRYNYRTSD